MDDYTEKINNKISEINAAKKIISSSIDPKFYGSPYSVVLAELREMESELQGLKVLAQLSSSF